MKIITPQDAIVIDSLNRLLTTLSSEPLKDNEDANVLTSKIVFYIYNLFEDTIE